MNEPRKSLIETAAKKRWPDLESIYINQRKHTLRVTFPLVGRSRKLAVRLIATSHRELLRQVEGAAQ